MLSPDDATDAETGGTADRSKGIGSDGDGDASMLLMVQKILHQFEVSVKRLETSVLFSPYSLIITLQQGLTLGAGRLPSLQEEEQQEFRSVLQARGGRDMFSATNAAANPTRDGRNAPSKAEAMPVRSRASVVHGAWSTGRGAWSVACFIFTVAFTSQLN